MSQPLTKPVRVCLFADTLGRDGPPEKLVVELATRLDPSAVEAQVCCFEPSERLSSLGKYVRTAVFPVPAVNSGGSLRQLWRFHRYLNRHGIQAIHSFTSKSAVFSVLASRATSCSAIITSRFNTGSSNSKRELALLRMVNRYSTHILANSLIAKEHTAKVERIPADKIAVFYPGIDLNPFALARESSRRRNGVPVVGIAANFGPAEDLPVFLRAAAIVLRAAEARFLLVGRGELTPELQRLTEWLGIAGSVMLSPPGDSIPDCLATVSVACISSESERFPGTVLEYMAAGLPVVARETGAVSELIRDGGTGFLVREGTPEAFAAPILRLLRDPDLRASMGGQAWERAKVDFDISRTVARLQDFYRDAVKRPTI
ncbi:MAG: glycosyltransferase family 4 protein [Bryobacterales bacterium]|nr:glycosyltransferase family 4 protein [Bryobacterales bacterium]MBV9399583.1 glycosyltransferase family 4 protein [Bryobacterales bacterium]